MTLSCNHSNTAGLFSGITLLSLSLMLSGPGVWAEGKEEAKEEAAEEAGEEDKAKGVTPLKVLGVKGFGFELGGYFRSRFYHQEGVPIDISSGTQEYTGKLRYFDTRLKLAPVIKYADVVKLTVWFHILDDAIWGDNAGISSTGITADEPSTTNRVGDDVGFLSVKAAWLELNLKLLVMRIGRIPSDFGLGLLTASSDGPGLEKDFGWNRYSSVYDRILLATEPVTIILNLAKAETKRFPLIVVYSYDQLVEDEIGMGRTRLPYSSEWLGDNTDDVKSHNFAAVYVGDPVKLVTPTDKLIIGAYFVMRSQEATFSDLYIIDGFVKLQMGPPNLYGFLEAEAYGIRGQSMAFALGEPVTDQDWCREHGHERCPDWLYQNKKADIASYFIRAGVYWKAHPKIAVQFKIETGYASGDDVMTDEHFTGRSMHPDVKVGLVLYSILLHELWRQNWVDNPGLWSNGGVTNSFFVAEVFKLTALDMIDFVFLALQAWPDEVDHTIVKQDKMMGYEFDLGVRVRLYHDHALLGLDGGVLVVGEAFETDRLDFLPDHIWTIQFWAAYVI